MIGNSPDVLKYKFGQIIDSDFDLVIRVNNFHIRGFDEHVGKRVDRAFISYAARPNPALHLMSGGNIYLYAANKYSDIRFLRDRLKSRDEVNPGCGIQYDSVRKLSPSLYFFGLKLLLDLPTNQWPSTGVVAIQWALDYFSNKNDVFIHGFSFFEESGEFLEHYFPIINKRDSHHNFTKEKRYISNMLDRSKIYQLEDYYLYKANKGYF